MKKERNGLDALNVILAIIAAILIGISFPSRNIIPLILAGILVIWFLFRALSTNLEKRQSENRNVTDIGRAISDWWKLTRTKWKDRKTYVYTKCPKCRQVLRMKRKKGKKQFTCPHCGTPITLTIHFKGEEEKQAEKQA